MLYALGVIAFALGLLASIALHEIGHLTPAKKFGVKVTQYMVGFGPTIWSRAQGRHRVRHQGHPARRLHPHDRHGAAGRERQAVPLAPPAGHAGRGVPGHQPGRGRTGGRTPPVLPADPGQEDDHHARRSLHEPADLPADQHPALRHRRTEGAHHHGQLCEPMRGAGDLDRHQLCQRRPRRATRPRRRPACSSPATRSPRSTGPRSRTGTTRSASSRQSANKTADASR